MELRSWPAGFVLKKRGIGCPQCSAGRVDETEHGVRYFVGEHAGGYLQRRAPTLGYSVVIFRGRHVGDPQSMTAQEHAGFWSDVSVVANAIEAAFGPIHLRTSRSSGIWTRMSTSTSSLATTLILRLPSRCRPRLGSTAPS